MTHYELSFKSSTVYCKIIRDLYWFLNLFQEGQKKSDHVCATGFASFGCRDWSDCKCNVKQRDVSVLSLSYDFTRRRVTTYNVRCM